jgi:signal peptidase I
MDLALALLISLVALVAAGLTAALVFLLRDRKKTLFGGKEDASLLDESYKDALPKSRRARIARGTASGLGYLVLCGLLALFAFAFVDRVSSPTNVPFTLTRVATASMATKNPENAYLTENDLNDQIQADDVVALVRVSSFDDIDLYDVVSYRDDNGTRVIHRVVDKETDYLLTRGDANADDDPWHVTFSMIVGKYEGFRIPYAGVVVSFLQSDYGLIGSAGVLYILCLVVVYQNQDEKWKLERKRKLRELVGALDDFVLEASDGRYVRRNGSGKLEKSDPKSQKGLEGKSSIPTCLIAFGTKKELKSNEQQKR